MKLSTKGRYGLTAMLYLARHADEGPLPLRMMDETGIQPDYLEQLLASLRKAGLVCTSRGAQGGYSLARAPEDITVGDVISATEGPVRFCECDSEDATCSWREHCDARSVWVSLSQKMNDLLDSITLASVLEDLNKEASDA
ncbi:MAG: Rrf2 family transcriptional regulator [Clostridia bacterium]|nr:Rrf2 family transcriptional regulator [Clostridia bacterium]MBR4457963.1 Rrf2 family transcriptional regulator [Clostridia bacterium]